MSTIPIKLAVPNTFPFLNGKIMILYTQSKKPLTIAQAMLLTLCANHALPPHI
jgi:hypothetical protein